MSRRGLQEAFQIYEIDLGEALEPGRYEAHGSEVYLDEGYLVIEDEL